MEKSATMSGTKIIFKRKYNMMYTGADFDIGLRYSEVSFIDLII